MKLTNTIAAGLTILALTVPTHASEEKESKFKEVFIGNVLDTTGSVPRNSTRFTLMVEHYTTDEEARELAGLLKEGGQDALNKKLSKMQVGRVQFGSRISYRVGIVRSLEKIDGGRVVRVVTDRPISFVEQARMTRTRDYDLGIIELHLDDESKGEGGIIVAARVSINEKNALEVESFGLQGFRIVNVQLQ